MERCEKWKKQKIIENAVHESVSIVPICVNAYGIWFFHFDVNVVFQIIFWPKDNPIEKSSYRLLLSMTLLSLSKISLSLSLNNIFRTECILFWYQATKATFLEGKKGEKNHLILWAMITMDSMHRKSSSAKL